MADPRQEVLIDYTNWRGERRWRRIRPVRIAYENSEWHHDTQWIMHAVDLEAAANREFAMKDIHAWKAMSKGWIGVDLDGTLAYYDHWRGPDHIGEPIQPMLDRVKRWLTEGKDVRIFTARVDGGTVALSMGNPDGEQCRDVLEVMRHIQLWCEKYIGRVLPITCRKDYGMVELWDDRCVQVIPNTGRTIADELESERSARAGKTTDEPSEVTVRKMRADWRC